MIFDPRKEILDLRAEIKRITEKSVIRDEELKSCIKKLRRTGQRLAIVKAQRDSYIKGRSTSDFQAESQIADAETLVSRTIE